jgi:6-pyruvoyltetrahydropterin/6-carboxytetrahydropterin synthase
MYELTVSLNFSAAHHLEGYPGECADPHGHNFKVEAVVMGEKLDEVGMVIDLRVIKMELKKVVSEFDHKYLNRLSIFKEKNPTSENIATHIYQKLSKRLSKVRLKEIRVFEGESLCVSYSEGDHHVLKG